MTTVYAAGLAAALDLGLLLVLGLCRAAGEADEAMARYEAWRNGGPAR